MRKPEWKQAEQKQGCGRFPIKILCAESGQALVFVAFGLAVVLGFVGLAVDVGVLLHAKRNMQIVADSAAIAGASMLNINPSAAQVEAAGLAAAAQNGNPSGSNGVTVTVNDPPMSGPHTGAAGYVEAIATRTENMFFARLFGFSSMRVTARAVATNGGRTSACVYILNSGVPQSMDLQGSFTVSAPNCGVIVDSNSSTALNFTGAGGSLTAGYIGVVGGDSGQTGDSTPAPVTGIAPESDPLGSLPAPTYNPASCTAPPTTGNWGPATAGGTVCYSPAVAGGTITISNTTLNPGTYVFNGNVAFSGTVTGTGVTFYLLAGLNASNGTMNLVAPITGPYTGILIYAARSDTSPIVFDKGSASGLLKGIIYAPSAPMELHDSGGDKNGGLQLVVDLIVNTLYDQTATLSITSYTQSGNPSPLTSIKLVE